MDEMRLEILCIDIIDEIDVFFLLLEDHRGFVNLFRGHCDGKGKVLPPDTLSFIYTSVAINLSAPVGTSISIAYSTM